MSELKISLGAKYYNDNSIIRIIRFKNRESVKVKNLLNNKYEIISIKDIDNKYILLAPDAAIAFNIVKNKDIEDVIVTCNRAKGDTYNGRPCPYLVLRQNMLDIHANILQNDNLSGDYVGCAVSLDNIPEGVDYNILTACDELLYYTIVYYYIDDKLDDILECIPNISKYNNVLEDINKTYCKFKGYPVTPGINGYCTSLKDLIVVNNMMYCVRLGFGILPIKSDITIERNNKLPLMIKEDIEILLSHRILDEFLIEYKKDIDLDKISNHILLCDNNENIYLLKYTKGDHIAYDPDSDTIINLDKSKYNL